MVGVSGKHAGSPIFEKVTADTAASSPAPAAAPATCSSIDALPRLRCAPGRLWTRTVWRTQSEAARGADQRGGAAGLAVVPEACRWTRLGIHGWRSGKHWIAHLPKVTADTAASSPAPAAAPATLQLYRCLAKVAVRAGPSVDADRVADAVVKKRQRCRSARCGARSRSPKLADGRGWVHGWRERQARWIAHLREGHGGHRCIGGTGAGVVVCGCWVSAGIDDAKAPSSSGYPQTRR